VQGRRLLGTEHASPVEILENHTVKSFA